MQIEEKYELLEPISGFGGLQDVTIPAWERTSGRLVFVHILKGGYAPETSQVLSAIGRLAPEYKQRILGAGDLSGSAYVVTDALPWGTTLRAWLASVSGNDRQLERPANEPRLVHAGMWKIPVNQPIAEPAPPNPPPAEPEVFTGGMRAMSQGDAAALETPAGSAKSQPHSQPLPVAAPTAPTLGEPGEFTRFLQAAKLVPEAPPGSSKPAPSGTARSAGPEPGEFTRLMQSVKPVREAATKSEAPSPNQTEDRPGSEPGEFTRLMRAGIPAAPDTGSPPFEEFSGPTHAAKVDPEATSQMVAPGCTDAEVVPPSAAPGNFTRLLSGIKPTAPADPPAALADAVLAVPSTAPPETTMVRQQLGETRFMPTFKTGAASPTTPAKPPTPPRAEAGEFTLLINADRPAQMPTSQFPVSPVSAPPPAGATAENSPWRYDISGPQPPTDRPGVSGTGEFTKMFQAPRPSPSNLPVLPPKPAGEGEFTRMMRAPSLPGRDLFSAPPAPPAVDEFAVRGGEVQRDEFSHLVTISNPQQQQAPGAKATAAPGPNPKISNLPLILIVGGLLLVAIALIVIVALMR